MTKTGAAYFLKHSGVGKTTHAKYTAAAHYRYIARLSAVGDFGGFVLPEDYNEAQAFLRKRERDIRANGKVCDKIIVNLPYSLGADQRTTLVKDFCDELSQGRAPYGWFVHTDTDAPHAHILFIDADIETGKRVFKLSDSGALFRLRKVWESMVNKHLAMQGHDIRVSRWGKHSQHYRDLNPNMEGELQSNVVYLEPPQAVSVTAFAIAIKADEELAHLETVAERVQQIDATRNGYEASLKANRSKQAATQTTIDMALADHDRAARHLGSMKGIKPTIKRWFSSAARARFEAAKIAEMTARQNVVRDTNALANLHAEAQRLRLEEANIENAAREASRLKEAYGSTEQINAHKALLRETIIRQMEQITVEELRTAHHYGSIQPQQYARLMQAKGHNYGRGY